MQRKKYDHLSLQWQNVASIFESIPSKNPNIEIRRSISNSITFDKQVRTNFIYQLFCKDNIENCKDYGLKEILNFDCVWSLAKISPDVAKAADLVSAQSAPVENDSNGESGADENYEEDEEKEETSEEFVVDNNEVEITVEENFMAEKKYITYPCYCITTVDKNYKPRIVSIAICSSETGALISSFFFMLLRLLF